jgi:hypothetical protein
VARLLPRRTRRVKQWVEPGACLFDLGVQCSFIEAEKQKPLHVFLFFCNSGLRSVMFFLFALRRGTLDSSSCARAS